MGYCFKTIILGSMLILAFVVACGGGAHNRADDSTSDSGDQGLSDQTLDTLKIKDEHSSEGPETEEIVKPDCTHHGDCDDDDPCTIDECLGQKCHQVPAIGCCDIDEDCLTDSQCKGHGYCQDHRCKFGIPYCQSFDGKNALESVFWTTLDYGTTAIDHWSIESAGTLGPDSHVQFVGHPTTDFVKSVIATPIINASAAAASLTNTEKVTTLQWRMAYNHSKAGETVTMSVVASENGDFASGEVVWQAVFDGDMEYDLYSVELPAGLDVSVTLQIGFLIEADSTFNMDNLQIDDIVLAEGVANRLAKAMIYRCKDPTDCDILLINTIEPELESGNPCSSDTECATGTQCTDDLCTGVPDHALSLDQRSKYVLCYEDPDTVPNKYVWWGWPHAHLDSSPLHAPSFVTPEDFTGIGDACIWDPAYVDIICGAGIADYFCVLDVYPQGFVSYVGPFHMGILAHDEWHADQNLNS